MATTRKFICLIFAFLYIANFIDITDAVRDCWAETPDVHGLGGNSTYAINAADCRAICEKDVSCVAVDWEVKGTEKLHHKCWILKTAVVKPTTEEGFIIHYKLNRTCLPPDRIAGTPAMTKSYAIGKLTTNLLIHSPTIATNRPTAPTSIVGIHREARRHGVKRVHAIRPVYMVLAGLGAGNLLLVVIAIGVICSYPLNRNKSEKTKNGVDPGGGGGGVADNVEMMNTYLEPAAAEQPGITYYEEEEQYPAEPQQISVYSNQNEINDKRYESKNYEDEDPPPIHMEENPYFNREEIIEASNTAY